MAFFSDFRRRDMLGDDDVATLELFPVDCQSTPVKEDGLRYRKMGRYLVLVVNLVVSRHQVAVLRLVS